MKTSGVSIGPLETQFLAWSQSQNKTEVRTGDLVEAMKLSAKQEANLFHNLYKSGLILQIWRGFYLVPKKIPPNGKWNPSPYLVINKYMKELGAKYQVSGPAVFNSYGFLSQVASEFLIYNNRVSKEVNILQYRFVFAKVKEARLGETKEFYPLHDAKETLIIFSSPERALLDALYDYKRFGTLPKAYNWILSAIKDKTINVTTFSKVVSVYGNTMSKKRIGWLLQKIGIEKKNYEQIRKKIPKKKFLVPLDPRNYKGPINKTWGVIENVNLSSPR